MEIRSTGTLGNPNTLAIFLVLSFPILLYSIEKEFLNKSILWGVGLIIIAGLLCTLSRKGFGTFMIVYFLYYFLKKKYKHVVVGMIVVIVIASGIASYGMISGRLKPEQTYKELENKKDMSMAGLQMFKTSPLIGLGYKGYYHNFWKYNVHSSRLHYDAHNIFITALVNYGIVGFIPFLAILFYPLVKAVKIYRKKGYNNNHYAQDMAIICMCTLIPFMTNGYFAGGLFYNYELMVIMYGHSALIFVCDKWPPVKTRIA
jgi:O-antigen ligase